jgi:hypothetical protein
MASVIHALWESEDKNLLIMPSSIPLSDPAVSSEILRYLQDNWEAVVDSDVDGEQSHALSLDRENPNLARYSASRRVARSVFLETAPHVGTGNQGVDVRTVKLGCAQPGETVATFGDALRRMSDQATYMYVDGPRNWFDTQPNVTRTAHDRANQLDDADVDAHIVKILRDENRSSSARGHFSGLHIAPEDSADVPDETETRLVMFGPDRVHGKGDMESDGVKAALMFLNQRGKSPRIYRNSLAFLLPDKRKIDDVRDAARQFLAWDSIVRDTDSLNLSAHSAKQSRSKKEEFSSTLALRLQEAWRWCISPAQPAGSSEITWDETRVSGTGGLAERAGKKMVEAGSLCTVLGGPILTHHLDKWLWKELDHIKLTEIRDNFSSYLYLPRLSNSSVLTQGIYQALGGLINEDFAVADRVVDGEYIGLRDQGSTAPSLDGHSVLVKYAVAKEFLVDDPGPGPDPDPDPPIDPPIQEKRITGFHASVDLKADRPTAHVGKLVEEVFQHLITQQGAKAKFKLNVEVEFSEGVNESTQRTVLENSKALKFDEYGFRKE